MFNRIQQVLNEKGYTQEELAKAIGKSRETVNAYCRNDRQPTIDILFEAADFLGVEKAELLGDGREYGKAKK